MGDKFVKINDYIIRKNEIFWVKIEENEVEIRMNNGDVISNITETEEEARKLYQAIWELLK